MPYVEALALPSVCSWIVVGSLLAWLTAPGRAGTLDAVGDVYSFVGAWLAISVVAAVVWSKVQWRRRAALPVGRPLAPLWSMPASTAIVIAMFLPTYVARETMSKEIRTLLPRSKVALDIDIAALPSSRVTSKHELEATVPLVDALRRRYLSQRVNDLSDSCVIASSSGVFAAASPFRNACDELRAAAQMMVVRNLRRLAQAHGMLSMRHDPDHEGAIVVIGLAMLIGGITACAGVVSWSVVVTALIVPAATIPGVVRAAELLGADRTAAWQMGWLCCGLLILAGSITLIRGRARSVATDAVLVLGYVWPVFMVTLQLQFGLEAHHFSPAERGALWPEEFGALWAHRDIYASLLLHQGVLLLLSPLLARYRCLPRLR